MVKQPIGFNEAFQGSNSGELGTPFESETE